MSSAWLRWRAPMALGLALACGASANTATAQFFFRPFAYTYRYDLPPEDDFDAPRFGSRRAVARILSREGFQLVGPLGRRGDQIVATGVSRREGGTRFFIDPFEGQIIYGVRIGPPPADSRARLQDGSPPQPGGARVKKLGRDRPLPEEARGANSRNQPEAPVSESPAPPPAATSVIKPAAPAKPAEAARATEARPVEWGKPAEIAKPAEPQKAVEPAKTPDAPKSAKGPNPQEAAKPVAAKPVETLKSVEATKPVDPSKAPSLEALAPKQTQGKPASATLEPAKSEAAKADAAKPVKPTPKPLAGQSAKAPAPKAVAARSTGGSHRAIVPPKTEGVTVVTPSATAMSTAHSPAGARTPQSVAMPKQ